MVGTQLTSMIGPPVLALHHRPWPPEIRGCEQRVYHTAGSWTRATRSLLRQTSTSNSKFATAAAAAPDWAVSLCDRLEAVIFASDPTLQPPGPVSETLRDYYYLSNSFEPVPEMPPTTDLHVTGTIPECLNGEFMRVGPNPKFMPRGGYHWFDGDGMIHGLQMKNGKATYVARYVQTCRLQQEEHYGAPKFLKIGDLRGMKGFYCLALEVLRRSLGVLQTGSEGVISAGNANTSLIYHNKKLLALQEGDKPYIIKVLGDGDLQTVGLEDYGQTLQHSFGAHPKIDPVTGEMFTIAQSAPALLSPPHLIYRVVSKEGILGDPVPITSSVMHDFAITENYAIFMDLPLGLNFLAMAKGEFGIKFDSSKESRLGVLPRYATDDSKLHWFTIPTCYIFHTLNAWEEGDEIVLTCCRMGNINLDHWKAYGGDYDSVNAPKLYEYRMNLRTGDVQQRQLSNLAVELPRINTDYTGRKVRYAYCFTGDDQSTGLAKLDFTMEPPPPTQSAKALDLRTRDNVVGLFMHGLGRYGGDTVFVPRNQGMAMGTEDDGYLISFVHDETTGKSEVIIIDAKTMGPEPVAVVELPRRVPHGFHAHFLTQEQLRQQG